MKSRCIACFEQIAEEEGAEILGWRDVPTDSRHLGVLARATEPAIQQIFVGRGKISEDAFERKLCVIRRRVEKAIATMEGNPSPFYITSLSSRRIVYKGLLFGTQLSQYYPDLNDPRFVSPYVLIHQRHSTNTLPTWNLAQPFRFLGHNGEINTLRGNINRMRAREALMASPLFGEDIEKIKPVIVEGGSDSAILDNVLELLILAGRSLPHAMMMLIPEAHGPDILMSEDKRAFYEFHAAMMEPWDGPAALVATDGRYIGATLDRNGLRPCRYTITRDGLVILASETGVIEIQPQQIQCRGRLQPGKMFLVDLLQHRIIPDNEIKTTVARHNPYRRWVADKRIELRGLFAPAEAPKIDEDQLIRLQHVFGYTEEDLRVLVSPMASQGQEAVGSMGNDAVCAVFSKKPQRVFSYFKQLFAQVTNPPIDPLREELVMSLESFVGRDVNFLEESPEHYRILKLNHPIRTMHDMERIRNSQLSDIKAVDLAMTFPAKEETGVLQHALKDLFYQAEEAIDRGATLLILSDTRLDEGLAPIPSFLATSGLHHHLIRKGLRGRISLIAETGEAREVIHFAMLIAYGAEAICPYVAFQTVQSMAEKGFLENSISPEQAVDNYITAVKKGLLKTLSRMGISTIHSFFGSQTFEALGLSSEVIEGYFPGTASRIGGIGVDEIARETLVSHRKGFLKEGPISSLLDPGGAYRIRVGEEKHLWTAEAIYRLQQSVRNEDYRAFKIFSSIIDREVRDAGLLRGLLEFVPGKTIPIEEVEPIEKIVSRFVGAAMSFGSISKEAHETIALAMNRLGARSNSGEGGEALERNRSLPQW